MIPSSDMVMGVPPIPGDANLGGAPSAGILRAVSRGSRAVRPVEPSAAAPRPRRGVTRYWTIVFDVAVRAALTTSCVSLLNTGPYMCFRPP